MTCTVFSAAMHAGSMRWCILPTAVSRSLGVAPDICCSTLVRYCVSPGSEVTIIVRPYCRRCWKDSGG